ncbi:hypothetical protein VTN02DRAFT_6281 [Thermoascus thermophilus]
MYHHIAIGSSQRYLWPNDQFPDNLQDFGTALDNNMDQQDLKALSMDWHRFLGFEDHQASDVAASILGKRVWAPWEMEAQDGRMVRRGKV